MESTGETQNSLAICLKITDILSWWASSRHWNLKTLPLIRAVAHAVPDKRPYGQQGTLPPVHSCWYLSSQQHGAGHAPLNQVYEWLPSSSFCSNRCQFCSLCNSTINCSKDLVVWLLSVWESFPAESRGIVTICKIHGRLFAKRKTCHVYTLMEIYKFMIVTRFTDTARCITDH